MAYCTRCGAELPGGARFCPNCGQTAEEGATAATAQPHVHLPREGEAPSEGVAIIALLLNVFLLPGLGSLIAGRREGWYQILLAVVGVLLGGLFGLFAIFGAAPMMARGGFPEAFFAGFFFVLLGMLAGLSAWIWGLITGISLLRESMSRPRTRPDA